MPYNLLWRQFARTVQSALLGLLGLSLSAAGADFSGTGFLYDEFPLTLASGHRTEAVGPLYYQEERETERSWGVPPLLTYTKDPDVELTEWDFIYPVLTYHRYGEQYRWQICQLLSFAGGPTQKETYRDRFTLFPLYFQQHSSDSNETYVAAGPFYGHLKHRLMRDEIFYVMFPCYSETRKGDVVTDNYLYPLFHVRHGTGLEGWQVWPLTGHEHKDVTTRTNGFNDVETVPGHEKFFALWPLFYNNHTGLGSTNPVWDQACLPAYSLRRPPLRDSTTVLWPLFTRVDDREKQYREWDAPWPLIEYARGTGKTTTRLWPLFSHSASTNLQSDFYLWPIYKYNRIQSAPLDRRRTRIVFFLYSDVTDKNTETGAFRRRVDFLPFFTHHRDMNGDTRLQIFSILEPFLPENTHIAREYAPLYSLWRSEHNAKTGASSGSLLWNLYRRDVAPGRKKVSCLFGLYQTESGPQGSRVRLFYIPVSKSGTKAKTPPNPTR